MAVDTPKTISHLSRILRTDENAFTDLIKRMSALTGRQGVLTEIENENSQKIEDLLKILHVHEHTFEHIRERLSQRLVGDDHALYHALGDPSLASGRRASTMVREAVKLVSSPPGLFLKKSAALKMLKAEPPPATLTALGYQTVDALIAQEDWREVFSALRFIESREWMNEKFFKQYEALTPDDFEQRGVEMIVLSSKWLTIAKKFIEKKYHNVSHLKELGIIFVIPLEIDSPGETMLIFSLMLHYLNEVHFYARLIERYAADKATFTAKLISLLRGDVGEASVVQSHKLRWLIVQRYLSKENKNDPRLFVAHTNSEAIHWQKAERAIGAFAEQSAFSDLVFWAGLGHIGDFFPITGNGEDLISFNIIDTAVAVARSQGKMKYLYHHQEALWNRIFAGFYPGPGQLEEYIVDNFDKGYIELEG